MAGLLKSLSAGTRCSDLHFVICVKVLVLVLAVQPLLMGNLQTPYTDGRITRLKVVGKSRAHVAQLLALSLALPPMRPPFSACTGFSLGSSPATFLAEKASRSCTNKFVLQSPSAPAAPCD